MSDKKWVERGGGSFRKWDTPGVSIEGIWRGTAPNSFDSLNGQLDTPAGRVAFPYTRGLEMLLQSIAVGTEIKLVYNGFKSNPNGGKDFKDFTLYIAENGDNADPDAEIPNF